MPFPLLIPLLTAAFGGIAGAAGNTGQTQNQNTNSSNNSNTLQNNSGTSTNTSSTNPNLNPETQGFLNQLMQMYSGSLAPANFDGIRAEGIKNINANSNLKNTLTQNALGARGFQYSPIAAISDASNQAGRLDQISTFQNNSLLDEDKYNQNKLDAAGNFFSRIPLGTTTTGSGGYSTSGSSATSGNSQSNTVNRQAGNPMSGFLGGLGSTLVKFLLGGGFGGAPVSGDTSLGEG